VNTAAFAALTASLYRKAARAADAAGFGGVSVFELEAERGGVVAAGRNGLLVLAVADPGVNLGLVRVELLRAAATF
jgi:predicted regulator of Ras-like GTPase activity (Roadblock/LC7/MglB family)